MKVIATRIVDEIGRIVLPIELRSVYQIEEKDALDICVDDSGQIVLRLHEPCCRICGNTDNLSEIPKLNIFVCSECQKDVMDINE